MWVAHREYKRISKQDCLLPVTNLFFFPFLSVMRTKVAKELVTTENTYVESIENVVKVRTLSHNNPLSHLCFLDVRDPSTPNGRHETAYFDGGHKCYVRAYGGHFDSEPCTFRKIDSAHCEMERGAEDRRRVLRSRMSLGYFFAINNCSYYRYERLSEI